MGHLFVAFDLGCRIDKSLLGEFEAALRRLALAFGLGKRSLFRDVSQRAVLAIDTDGAQSTIAGSNFTFRLTP